MRAGYAGGGDMSDYAELKRLAEAATPGEWKRDTRKFGGVIYGGPIQHWVNGSGQSQVAMTTGADWMRPGETEGNADFIAAANPAVVLALIAERDKLKAENEALRLERKGKVLCDLELFETLRDSAYTEADEHHQCMATYRPLRQEALDSVVRKCDELLAMSKEP